MTPHERLAALDAFLGELEQLGKKRRRRGFNLTTVFSTSEEHRLAKVLRKEGLEALTPQKLMSCGTVCCIAGWAGFVPALWAECLIPLVDIIGPPSKQIVRHRGFRINNGPEISFSNPMMAEFFGIDPEIWLCMTISSYSVYRVYGDKRGRITIADVRRAFREFVPEAKLPPI